MRLHELAAGLAGARLNGGGDLPIEGITHDSRAVEPGWIFAALPGASCHGVEHLDEALHRGAAAVISDRERPETVAVPWLATDTPRVHMARAAWALAGDPQKRLLLVGVTGTNGKSTTAHLVSLILNASGCPAGFFGTLGHRLPGAVERASERTTPEATDLAPLLAELLESGGRAAVMEVSSHAIMLDRVAGLDFQVAVWTNLSHDHLDFHATMQAYFEAKKRLFTEHLAAKARRVLPVADQWASQLLAERRAGDLSWGIEDGDVFCRQVSSNLDGSSFTLCVPDAELPMRLPLIGEHNLANAVAACAAAHAAGISLASIAAGLAEARPLPGRLERVATQLSFPVFVDYAHTPDGLRAVLTSLRALTDRRLIVVFGAGGDRDTHKRGPMGAAVGELADLAIVTSDNPRSEDPATIAAAVADGVRSCGGEPQLVLDRRQAIAHALSVADDDALVLVAGKGHENTQIVGEHRIPFLDREVIGDEAGRLSCG